MTGVEKIFVVLTPSSFGSKTVIKNNCVLYDDCLIDRVSSGARDTFEDALIGALDYLFVNTEYNFCTECKIQYCKRVIQIKEDNKNSTPELEELKMINIQLSEVRREIRMIHEQFPLEADFEEEKDIIEKFSVDYKYGKTNWRNFPKSYHEFINTMFNDYRQKSNDRLLLSINTDN